MEQQLADNQNITDSEGDWSKLTDAFKARGDAFVAALAALPSSLFNDFNETEGTVTLDDGEAEGPNARFGSSNVDKMYYGDKEVTKAYWGTTEI